MIPPIRRGAHWFWTRVIPEMASRLTDGEEFHLLVSPKSRPMHQGYGANVHYITFPWSNESPPKRTLSEHIYAPVRLPLSKIDVLSTLIAPIVEIGAVLGRALQDPARIHSAAVDTGRRTPVPADELPAHGQGRGRDHHQLGEPASRGHALSGRRPRQVAPHPRSR